MMDTKNIDALYIGDTPVDRLYMGDALVWERPEYAWNVLEISAPPSVIDQTGMAFAGYWADGKLCVVQEIGSPRYTMYWGERTSYRTQHETAFPENHKSQVIPANAVIGDGVTSIPGFTDGGTWLIGVFRRSGNNLIGFFHAESGWGGLEAYKSIGVTYSTDNGLTWTPGEKILNVDYPKPASPAFGGLGDACVVYDHVGERFICYYSAFVTGADYMICMAASDTGASGTWMKWNGTGFTVPGYDSGTGLGGADSAIGGLITRSGANPSVMWNDFLGKWIMTYSGWDNIIYLSSSDDCIVWEAPIPITSSGEDARYPNLISSRGDTIGGRIISLYYGKDQQPVTGTREFARRDIEFIPVPPDPNLPTPTTDAEVYPATVGQPTPVVITATNQPAGATVEFWAMSHPPGGINLGVTNPCEISPDYFFTVMQVPIYIRYSQHGYYSEWKQVTVDITE